MSKVLTAYREQAGTNPSRVVIHKSSLYDDAERQGFKNALDGVKVHDFLTIFETSRRIKFFRAGYNPALRGTLVTLPDESALLFTKGYIPFMRVYPGPRVPRPLEIVLDETESSRRLLCEEILALTRLNWNSADFCCLLPITLHFSRQVARILHEIPPGVIPQSRYLYYM